MNNRTSQSLSLRTLAVALAFTLSVLAAAGPALAQEPRVVKITAEKYKYTPNVIELKKGEPVVLEFTSLDRLHGFNCPAFKIRADIKPGQPAQVRFTPDKAGRFPFRCDNFCGLGHGDMTGEIVVTE